MGDFTTRKILAFLVVFATSMAGAGCGGGSSNIPPAATPAGSNVALWVANGTSVLEIIPSQTGVGDPAPRVTLGSGSFIATQGVQFDASGDLWVIDGGCQAIGSLNPTCPTQGSLSEYSAAQLAAHQTSPNMAPSKKITYTGIQLPQQGVFDKTGDLWVTDNMAKEVVEFTPAQLAAGGSGITPNLTLTSMFPFNGPLGIAFSPINGNLWIADNNNNNGTSIEGFAAASLIGLSGTHNLEPHDVLLDHNGSIQGPWALVFDASGNLRSSNSNPNFSTIVEFSAAEVDSGASRRSPAPNITIMPGTDQGNTTTLSSPNGLAFDNLGGLWAISSAYPFGISLFAAWQLPSGGSINPSIFLVGKTPLTAPAGDVFGPVVQ